MTVLTPLDPSPYCQVDGYDFVALAAGRGERGLDISVQVSNGDISWADRVRVAEREPRTQAAGDIAGCTKLTPARADFGLLQLLPKVEARLRESGPAADWATPTPVAAAGTPAFPIGCLPPWLRAMATATAEALQVPVDLPAMLSLAILGTALAKKVDVRVRQGYYVPLNAYVMLGMESGERKSPAYRAMLAPLVAYERERMASVKKENEQRLATKEPPLPTPQLFADDITTEQVPVLLEQNGERLAIFSDEGDSLDIMAGRYSKGTPNFGVYLKGWDGGAYKVNRGMRPSIFLAHPLLSIGLCVQPSVLRGLAETPSFRDRGLLGRFWFSLPASFVGWRKAIGAPVPEEVRASYERRVRALLDLPLPERPDALELSHEAHEVLVAFAEELEPRLGPDGDLREIKDWVAKLEGSAARLAGLLHGAAGGFHQSQISAQTMRDAITLARYLLAHAQATFGMMRAKPGARQADVLLRWIVRKGLVEFSRRDAYRENPSHFERPDDCLPALELLIEHGVIAERPQSRRGVGRPASPVYDVNPAALQDDSQNSRNCQNTPPPEETGEKNGATQSAVIPAMPRQNSQTTAPHALRRDAEDRGPPLDGPPDPWLDEEDGGGF
jgi:hypothetical protein